MWATSSSKKYTFYSLERKKERKKERVATRALLLIVTFTRKVLLPHTMKISLENSYY